MPSIMLASVIVLLCIVSLELKFFVVFFAYTILHGEFFFDGFKPFGSSFLSSEHILEQVDLFWWLIFMCSCAQHAVASKNIQDVNNFIYDSYGSLWLKWLRYMLYYWVFFTRICYAFRKIWFVCFHIPTKKDNHLFDLTEEHVIFEIDFHIQNWMQKSIGSNSMIQSHFFLVSIEQIQPLFQQYNSKHCDNNHPVFIFATHKAC